MCYIPQSTISASSLFRPRRVAQAIGGVFFVEIKSERTSQSKTFNSKTLAN